MTYDKTPGGYNTELISADSPQAIQPSVLVSYAPFVSMPDVEMKTLEEVIEEIRSSDKLKRNIEIVRAEKTPEKRRELKANLLPYFSFSQFTDRHRTNDNFKYTRFILLDIDHIPDRIEELKNAFCSDSAVFLFFVSPSGDGLKIVFALSEFAVGEENYRNTYAYFQSWLKEKYGVDTDASTKDPSHACFLSYDPELYVNWNASLCDVPNEGITYNLAVKKRVVEPNIIELLKGVVAPGRHRALTRLASFYKNEGRDIEFSIETLKSWNLRNNPLLDENEIIKQVEYVYRKENYGNRKMPKVVKIAPDDVKYEDVSNLQTEPIIYTPNLITGWMKTIGMNLLSGTEGSGKSMLALNLSLCVCRGEEFLGRSVRQGKVLYLDNELDIEEFKERVQKMNKPVSPDTFHILFDAPVMEADYVEAKMAEFQPSLVVIDSLYLASDAKEKDNDALKGLLRLLKGLAHKYQCVVFVITHFRKGTKYDKLHMDMTVGGGAQNRIVNGAFLMRRSDKDESKRIIKADKLRGFDDDGRKPRLLSFDKNTFTFHDEGEVNEELHIAHIGEEKMDKIDVLGIFKCAGKTTMTREEIVEKAKDLGYSERTADRAIGRANLARPKYGVYSLPDNDKVDIDIEKNNEVCQMSN